MVVCVPCGGKDRLITRSMVVKEVLPNPDPNDDMKSDPSVMTILFRCNKCKKVYSFTRVVTTDELREVKNNPNESGGCGGCGP